MEDLIRELVRWYEEEEGVRPQGASEAYHRAFDRLREIQLAQRRLEARLDRQEREQDARELTHVDPAPLAAPSTSSSAGAAPGPRSGAALLSLLSELRAAALSHPIAARHLFASLVEEGRRYAESEEGAALADRLRRSATVARARHAWTATTGWLLVGADRDPTLPSTLVDALLELAEREDLAELLERGGRDPRGR